MMTKQKGFVAALLLTTFFTPLRADATCTPTPDCAELGYTKTLDDCPDGAVKCPWDSSKVYCCGSCKCSESFKYTCTGVNEVAGKYQCGNKYAECICDSGYKWKNGSCSRPKCKIADIYYTDDTCVAAVKHDSTKTVLGIVVYVNPDGVGGQIMAPWPIDKDGYKSSSNVGIAWSTVYVDIAGVTNYTSNEAASKDYNSCSNTDAIVEQGDASTYPAAWATRKYAPNEETKGKWCLPAASVMTNLKNNKNAIQTAISKVSGVTYPDCCTWSSSEYGIGNAWFSSFNSSYGLNYTEAKTINRYVRPVLEF